jgi:hypothetical protein
MSETGKISDGYHTFDELYEHRSALFIAICRELSSARAVNPVWRSRLHADGTKYPEWFIMGINKEPGRQISYHMPAYLWPETECAETLERAPEWDGHTSADVIKRLADL